MEGDVVRQLNDIPTNRLTEDRIAEEMDSIGRDDWASDEIREQAKARLEPRAKTDREELYGR